MNQHLIIADTKPAKFLAGLFCVRWRVALNASDYAGQHKGYHGNISVTYKF